MKAIFTLVISLCALASLSACNTIRGAGQDIQRAGDAIEDAAGGR